MSAFYERDEESRTLERAIRDAVAGSGSVVILQGDAGIGKSSLVAVAEGWAAAAEMRTVSVEAASVETSRPFALARSLLRAAGVHFEFLSGATRYAIEEALLAEFEVLLTAAPVLLAVDDAHWIDEASAAVVQTLSRLVNNRPSLLLLAGRPPIAGTAYEKLMSVLVHRGATRRLVPPLSTDAVSQLAEQQLGAAPDPRLADALVRARGNPFFVHAILDHVVTSEGDESDANPSELAELSLREAVLGSVISAAPDAIEVLRAAAVIGRDFTVSVLAEMVGDDAVTTWGRLAPALQAGLIEVRDDHLAFRHELVREALYAEIAGPYRAEMHRRAAESLASAGHGAIEVGGHLLAGPVRRDSWAAEQLRRAGTEASGMAPATAAGFLRRALDVCPPDAGFYEAVASDLVMNLLWAADLVEAERMAVTLRTATAEPATVSALVFALGWAYWLTGRTDAAATLLEQGAADPTISPMDQGRLAALASWVTGFHLCQPERARDLAGKALSGLKDELAEVVALATLAGLTYLEGEPSTAAEEAARLAARATSGPSRELRHLGAHTLLTLSLIDSDLLTRADEAIAEGASIDARTGTASSAAMWHRTRALRHYAVGDWDDAVAELTALRELEADKGPQIGSMAGTAIHSMIFVHRGQLEEAGELLAGTDFTGRGPEFRGHWIDWARASYAEATGAGDRGFALLVALWTRGRRDGPAVDLPWMGPDLARLAMSRGEPATATKVAEALQPFATAGPPTFRAAALHAQGLARSEPDLLLSAAALYRPGRRRLGEAMALLDAGALLVEAERRPEATTAIEEAVGLLTDLRASPAIERAATLLDRAGNGRPRPAGRARPTSGWESLTPSESKVAALIAEGLANPEIAERLYISRRTVESHVARVLQKLGLRSRTQVVRAVLEAGALPTPRPS